MSASLVGSEMCIRDRSRAVCPMIVLVWVRAVARRRFEQFARCVFADSDSWVLLSLIHISEPTRLALI
eukprot:8294087-Alexandrium_andersonii.AAC.1